MFVRKSLFQIYSFWRFLIEKIKRKQLGASIVRWMRLRGYPFPVSWEAYRFLEYRRTRWGQLPVPSLEGIGAGGQKGLVSIVLPVFNGETFLQQAIQSILRQTYPHWELIAIDDGSTDRSGEILDQAAAYDKRIRVIHQPNRKLPAALNTGFRLAKGEYLTWTSYDNILHPDFLERMVAALEQNPSWDMVYANINLIGQDGLPRLYSSDYLTYQQPFGSEHIHLPVRTDELNILPNNFIGPAFLYRRRTALLIGEYSPERFTVEDYDYWMRVNALLHLEHLPESKPLYDYRIHAGALSAQRVEHAISQQTQTLLSWEGFRLDFYLTRCIWNLRSDARWMESEFVSQLKRTITSSRGILLEDQFLEKLPRSGLCLIRLDIVPSFRDLPLAPPRDARWLNVLAVVGRSAPEGGLPAGYDLGICLVSPETAGTQLNWNGPWLFVSKLEQLVASADIAARSHALRLIEDKFFHPRPAELKISVVVCSHQRAESLRKCINSLSSQIFPKQDYEVIIVNNAMPGSPFYRELDTVIQQVTSSNSESIGPTCHGIDCPVPGLSMARNVGLAEARGEVVCFIDDDAVAEPDWLSKLWDAFQNHPEIGVIGGSILLEEPIQKPWWYRSAWRRFWGHLCPVAEHFYYAKSWPDFPWGGNWAARRQALYKVGGFRSRYGRQAQKPTGGEEIIASALIQRQGYKIGIEPSAVVHHLIEPERFTLRNIWHGALASRKTWYQLQKEGYILWELSFRISLSRIIRAATRFHDETLFKVFFTIGAELIAHLWLFRDQIKRFLIGLHLLPKTMF